MATTASLPQTTALATSGGSVPRLVTAGAFLAVVGAVAMACSGTGYRLHVWGLDVAFRMFAGGAALAALGGLLALVALAVPGIRRRSRVLPIAAVTVVVAAAAAGTFVSWYLKARSVPGIHDITTDTGDPPSFEALRAARLAAPNGLEYGGDSVAAQQRAAYPDIVPAVLPIPPADAFRRSLMAAQALGWAIAAADSAAGRIEATATTAWYGFRDDVVIRIRPEGSGSRIDVRSDSRLGGSDVGTNAARIRRFLARVRA